jgi:flagellar biosynthesis/type III secretory pathway chaperone|tara:strand:- start:3120 stop:3500 length:381 start_codon:yes stop_codon:yes gene_type:complete
VSDAAIPDIRSLSILIESLKTLLDEEFVLLGSKDLDTVESIQERKISLMEELGNLWSSYLEASSGANENLPVKNEFQSKLVDCRDKHIRNDLLLKKQLEITKNLIQVITNRSNDQANIYNRLGRIS